MKHGAGWPMGPCELLDLVGIDVHVHAAEAIWEKLREPRHGCRRLARRDGERGAARPQERPRLLHVRVSRATGAARTEIPLFSKASAPIGRSAPSQNLYGPLNRGSRDRPIL